MYIKKIHIQNYRNFNDFTMEFHKGLNVIIGANNAGKTGLLRAINLLKNPSDISVDDLDEESFKIFRREALQSKRMTQEELNISNEELLSKLHLMSNGKLKRSAVLLFYHDPSIVQVGSHVQIGKFGEGADLQYQDALEESLICIADKVINLIYLKYLKAKITYENDRRVETYPFARDAVREAVYNAIAHNCYMFGSPIQIRIEEDAMIISNQCILPEGWTVDTLMQTHESKPYNPEIANVFYRAGYIERWGRGIEKICDAWEWSESTF